MFFWYPLKRLVDSGEAEATAEQIRKRLLSVLVTLWKFAEPAGLEADLTRKRNAESESPLSSTVP